MSNLFDIPITEPLLPVNTCRQCKHRERWQCGGSVIQYCGVRKSDRTENGLLKIKVTMAACLLFELETTTHSNNK